MRRIDGNFCSVVAASKISAGEDNYRMAVWDNTKREVLIYDLLLGAVDRSVQFSGLKNAVNLVTSLRSQNCLLASSKDNALRIWKLSEPKSSQPTSGKPVSLVAAGEGFLALSEDGALHRWSHDEKGAWSRDRVAEFRCSGLSGAERMTSLAEVPVPALHGVSAVAATCGQHCKVHFILLGSGGGQRAASQLMVLPTSRVSDGTKCVPLSCALVVDKQVKAQKSVFRGQMIPNEAIKYITALSDIRACDCVVVLLMFMR
jgi:hypothetical protein